MNGLKKSLMVLVLMLLVVGAWGQTNGVWNYNLIPWMGQTFSWGNCPSSCQTVGPIDSISLPCESLPTGDYSYRLSSEGCSHYTGDGTIWLSNTITLIGPPPLNSYAGACYDRHSYHVDIEGNIPLVLIRSMVITRAFNRATDIHIQYIIM
jgi:hypothetical protein